MPWSYPENVPAVAESWTDAQQQRCVEAANAVLRETGDEEQAIYACIAAAGKSGGRTMKYKSFPARFKALGDESEASGQFEALVAVFNNIDYYGDRILPGAFAKSLARWEESGDPIPVVFSHQWDNLDALIGEVLEAKETDEGLYVKAQLDMEEEFAARVWKKMKRRTLKEFSFAFDELASKVVDRGGDSSPRYINDLMELDLHEVGPCLKGVNPDTQLITVKGAGPNATEQVGTIATEIATVLLAMDPGRLHDLSVTMGATCAHETPHDEDKDGAEDEAGDGKSRGELSVLAARVAADLIENGNE